MGTRANDIATVFKESNLIDSDRIASGAISSGKLNSDITIANDLTVSNDLTVTNDFTASGIAKAGLVSLANSNAVTYDLSAGNVAKWDRNTSPVDATNTLTLDGTSGGALDGMGFTIMAFNGDNDSDRSITFAGGTGITVHYSDSATITWGGPNKHTVISGMVFDSANVLILSAGLVGSV